MSLSVWFWILMFVVLLFGLWVDYVPGQVYPYKRGGQAILLFLLLAILGWQVFGSAVK